MLDNETPESNSPAQELTDEAIDQLVERSETGTNREVPMTRDEQKSTEGKTDDQSPKEEIRYTFKHQGKEVSATKEQMLKWAAQGYNYPQLMQKFNQDKTTWESTRKQSEAKFQEYAQIDQWAQSNPGQWQALQQTYKQLVAGGMSPQAANQVVGQQAQGQTYAQLPPDLLKGVQEAVEFAKTQKTQAEDQALEQDIQSIREKHKDLDWDTIDENGKSLEQRVLDHAGEIGAKKFSVAFKDLLHDELINRAQAQAKQQVSKNIQSRTKLGVLGASPTSKRAISQPTDIRKTSYEDQERSALEELKAGLYG